MCVCITCRGRWTQRLQRQKILAVFDAKSWLFRHKGGVRHRHTGLSFQLTGNKDNTILCFMAFVWGSLCFSRVALQLYGLPFDVHGTST